MPYVPEVVRPVRTDKSYGTPATLSFDALREGGIGCTEAPCSPTVADHPSPGYLRAGKPYEHVSVTRGPGLRQLPESHVIEVVPGRQFQAPDCDHTPAGLEELISVVNLEGTHGVECMVEDLAVGNRAEDDAAVRKDVIHGQNAGAVISGIGDPAHGLGSE